MGTGGDSLDKAGQIFLRLGCDEVPWYLFLLCLSFWGFPSSAWGSLLALDSGICSWWNMEHPLGCRASSLGTPTP